MNSLALRAFNTIDRVIFSCEIISYFSITVTLFERTSSVKMQINYKTLDLQALYIENNKTLLYDDEVNPNNN